MGRTSSFDHLVLRCTDRTSPSRLTFFSMINANGHKACDAFSFTMICLVVRAAALSTWSLTLLRG